MSSTWTHLVRFEHNGKPTFAQIQDPTGDGVVPDSFKVIVATGDPVFDTIKLTNEVVTVNKLDLLAPVETCPIVVNCGLNYKDHVDEGVPKSWQDLFPPRPYIFYRPKESIAAPFSDPLAYKAQQQCLDFEGEMVFQVGATPLKNITPEEAKKHIIGFATGHDFTPRPGSVLGRMNFIWAKAFDDWTPLGPALVHPSVVGGVPRLRLTTKLNGKVVQESNTANMIFKPHEILSSMSYGHTVQPGTVVFSGTCGGGFYFTQDRNGRGILTDEESIVEVEKLGRLVNHVHFTNDNFFLDDKLGAGGPPDKPESA